MVANLITKYIEMFCFCSMFHVYVVCCWQGMVNACFLAITTAFFFVVNCIEAFAPIPKLCYVISNKLLFALHDRKHKRALGNWVGLVRVWNHVVKRKKSCFARKLLTLALTFETHVKLRSSRFQTHH